MYKKISDYGIIGNLHSIALIGIDGSIDWLCFPHIDDPSIFGALLDDEKGGRFSISPFDEWDSVSEYLPDTNILKTRFRTRTGVMELTDFMPIPLSGNKGSEEEHHELYRLLEVTKGKIRVNIIFEPRFDYARANTSVKKIDKVIFLTNKIILNDGEPRDIIPLNEIAPRLKRMMNILRGAFFDTSHGRVAYEQMSNSRVYREYVELTYSLKKLDLCSLKSREEKLAFWINLYNVIVIYGVIELGIKDSVKEVRNFFQTHSLQNRK